MTDVERGRRLKELRESVGLLQRQVGAEFDIDKAAVSEWERGKTAPDRRKLARLDEIYKADGEVLAMFDVASADSARIDAVVSRLDELEELARQALAQLLALTQRVVRLEEPGEPPPNRATR